MAETSSNTVTVPTDTQMQFLTCIMKNLKVKPDVDVSKLHSPPYPFPHPITPRA